MDGMGFCSWNYLDDGVTKRKIYYICTQNLRIMITAQRIQYLIRQGEGYKVDFKSAVPAKVRELSEEVCSFANAGGGFIFIGVDDNGQVVGCNISNSKRSAITDTISLRRNAAEMNQTGGTIHEVSLDD